MNYVTLSTIAAARFCRIVTDVRQKRVATGGCYPSCGMWNAPLEGTPPVQRRVTAFVRV
jgi:hypothetical protein